MIIGVAGKKRVGKDTVAAFLAKRHPIFRHVAFANKLKEVTGELFGLDFFIMTPEEKEKHRLKLKHVGDTMREIDPDIWINRLFEKYPDSIIISDVRYPNEINKIKERGGFVLHVTRDTGLSDTHRSETSLDKFKYFDYEIKNDQSFEYLYKEAETFMNIVLRTKEISS